MRRSTFIAVAFVSVPVLAATFPAVAAANADGEWKCIANGNIPIATLSVSGGSYDIETSDGGSGSGKLRFEGGSIIPQSGPLADDFVVVGSLQNSVLYWNNSSGTLMACWPR